MTTHAEQWARLQHFLALRDDATSLVSLLPDDVLWKVAPLVRIPGDTSDFAPHSFSSYPLGYSCVPAASAICPATGDLYALSRDNRSVVECFRRERAYGLALEVRFRDETINWPLLAMAVLRRERGVCAMKMSTDCRLFVVYYWCRDARVQAVCVGTGLFSAKGPMHFDVDWCDRAVIGSGDSVRLFSLDGSVLAQHESCGGRVVWPRGMPPAVFLNASDELHDTPMIVRRERWKLPSVSLPVRTARASPCRMLVATRPSPPHDVDAARTHVPTVLDCGDVALVAKHTASGMHEILICHAGPPPGECLALPNCGVTALEKVALARSNDVVHFCAQCCDRRWRVID